MAGTFTLKKDSIFKQDPTFQDKEQAKIPANQKINFSWIEIKDFRGTSFSKHLHLEVHLENGIESNQGNVIKTWFVDTRDVARID